MPVVNMLNAKYIIQQNPQNGQPLLTPNPDALGNCWFVKAVTFKKTPLEVMNTLTTLNTKDSAVVEDDSKDLVKYDAVNDSTAKISLVKNENDLAEYTSNASRARFAVFSEVYYNAGWKAYIDGKEATIVKTNYALRANMSKEEFTAEVLDGLGAPPAYFPQNVMMNIQGYPSLDSVMDKSKKPLSPSEFNAIANDTDAIILDVRHENDFVKCHIPRSIFIVIQGNFAPWVGSLIMNTKQPIMLITPDGMENETITRLSRVGFDHVLGYLEGGIEAWKKFGFETDSIHSISPEEFSLEVNKQSIVVDARKPSEYDAEHVENAINLPLDTINTHLDLVPKNENFYLHCAGGYRSVIMASILKSRGFHHFTNVEKGISGIRTTNVPLTVFVCPSTIK
jgi:rhodanese-related sulfurtransferase